MENEHPRNQICSSLSMCVLCLYSSGSSRVWDLYLFSEFMYVCNVLFKYVLKLMLIRAWQIYIRTSLFVASPMYGLEKLKCPGISSLRDTRWNQNWVELIITKLVAGPCISMHLCEKFMDTKINRRSQIYYRMEDLFVKIFSR